ncbi:MAG: hypothetical protein ACYCYO_05320 [Bacilli bacterium]
MGLLQSGLNVGLMPIRDRLVFYAAFTAITAGARAFHYAYRQLFVSAKVDVLHLQGVRPDSILGAAVVSFASRLALMSFPLLFILSSSHSIVLSVIIFSVLFILQILLTAAVSLSMAHLLLISLRSRSLFRLIDLALVTLEVVFIGYVWIGLIGQHGEQIRILSTRLAVDEWAIMAAYVAILLFGLWPLVSRQRSFAILYKKAWLDYKDILGKMRSPKRRRPFSGTVLLAIVQKDLYTIVSSTVYVRFIILLIAVLALDFAKRSGLAGLSFLSLGWCQTLTFWLTAGLFLEPVACMFQYEKGGIRIYGMFQVAKSILLLGKTGSSFILLAVSYLIAVIVELPAGIPSLASTLFALLFFLQAAALVNSVTSLELKSRTERSGADAPWMRHIPQTPAALSGLAISLAPVGFAGWEWVHVPNGSIVVWWGIALTTLWMLVLFGPIRRFLSTPSE